MKSGRKKDEPISMKFPDAIGKIVLDEEVQVQNGYFSDEYNIEGKAKGTYLLLLNRRHKWRHEKIVMQ